jgi:hypothetical protein
MIFEQLCGLQFREEHNVFVIYGASDGIEATCISGKAIWDRLTICVGMMYNCI